MSGSVDHRHYEGVHSDVVVRAFVDDSRSFEMSYDRYAGAVARFAWSVSPGGDAAQEILQETFLTAWDKRRSIRLVDGSALPWLLTTCRNHARNHARRERRWKDLLELREESLAADPVDGDAAVERTRTPEPPPTVTGDSVIEIGRPAPGDKWLNLAISYRCKPGEGFDLRDGGRRVAWADCDLQSFPDEDDSTKLVPGPGGIQKSIPVGDVRGTALVLENTLTDAVIVKAEFAPTSAMSSPEQLPANGPDGKPEWVIPTYPVNKFGLTVGNIRVDVPESAYPDLIPFELDGREVYGLKRSFILQLPGRPGEFSREEVDRARGVREDEQGHLQLKAYEADGKSFAGWVDTELQRTCTACL